MKFSSALISLAVLATGINAFSVPSVEARDLSTGTDSLAKRAAEAAPVALSDDDDVPDYLVADVDYDDDDEGWTPAEKAELAVYRAIPDPDKGLSIVEARDLEERGIKSAILKIVLKKFTKSKLGKKCWNKLSKAQRKRITKYVKKAGKKSKKSKTFLKKQVKPVVINVLATIVGTGAAKLIANDVIPWVVDAILLIIF